MRALDVRTLSKILFYTLTILLFPSPLAVNQKHQLVLWNVGQGQWLTFITPQSCFHFDVGGEYWDSKKISAACAHKLNRIFISHTDFDHIRLLSKISNWPRFCLENLKFEISSPFYRKISKHFTRCEPRALSSQPSFHTLTLSKSLFTARKASQRLSANDLSHIFQVENSVLIPGDSTTKAEKIWINRIKNLRKMRVLILGHHGSSTSTSTLLLQQLPNLKMAFVSARQEVYGHPHPWVVHRLQKKNVPTLSTEDWGHLRIDLE